MPHTFKDDALLSGEADAMSAYLGDQTYFYKQQGKRLNINNPANYGLDLYGDMLFTSEAYFLAHKKQALNFKRVTIKDWQYALDNPEYAANLIKEKYSKRKSKDALLHESKHTKLMIASNLIALGHINKARIQRIKVIYKHWHPELKDQDIDGILYSYHIKKAKDQIRFTISLFAIIAFILTIIPILLAIRWRRREKIITRKFS